MIRTIARVRSGRRSSSLVRCCTPPMIADEIPCDLDGLLELSELMRSHQRYRPNARMPPQVLREAVGRDIGIYRMRLTNDVPMPQTDLEQEFLSLRVPRGER